MCETSCPCSRSGSAKHQGGAKIKRKLTGAQQKKAKDLALQTELRDILLVKKRIEVEKPPVGYNPWANEDAATQAAEPERVRLEGEAPDEDDADKSRGGKRGSKAAKPAVLTSALLSNIKTFDALPLSDPTKRGLVAAGFTHLTRIQRGTLPHALAGRDVMGSARTGSGKTLAYLLPVLESLYLSQFKRKYDGLGALIIAPTRELAIQIYDVMRKVGRFHDFSAGLAIGGKDAESEKKVIGSINILVATPGRLLHHMDETFHFDASNLRILVLDEADRILDMGFASALDGILANLPAERQTLLFSATRTNEALENLAKLNLRRPEIVGVHDRDDNATPRSLTQHYMVLNAGDKLNTLWSFIKTHLWKKTIVFLATTKEVRFVFESFCHIRPGVPLLHMHGRMKQSQRMRVFEEFCNQSRAVMFCTDVAARGLDFPDVDWVVQHDCPESVEDYIHRVGRTARFTRKGHALCFLQEHERALVAKLRAAKVDVKEVRRDARRMDYNVGSIISGFLAEDTELKFLAQKAFVSYIRHVHMAQDKDIFSVREVDGPALAASMGLPGLPTIKSLKGSRSAVKNLPHKVREMLEQQQAQQQAAKADAKRRAADQAAGAVRKASEVEKLLRRQNRTVLDESRLKMRAGGDDEEDDDGFMTVTKRGHSYEDVAATADAAAAKAERRRLETLRRVNVVEEDDGTREAADDDLVRLAEEAGSSDDDDDDDDDDADAGVGSGSGDEEDAVVRADRERTARKAAKRAAKRRQIEDRLRKAMLTEGLQVATLEEAIRAGLDAGFVAELRAMVKEHDPADKARQRDRVRERREKAKAALREANRLRGRGGEDGEEYAVTLASASDEGSDVSGSGSGSGSDNDDDEEEESDLEPTSKRGRLAVQRRRHSSDDDDSDDDDDDDDGESDGGRAEINLNEESDSD
jgi:ATP-dependent RNA helicase DDX10/DBP4